MEGDDDELEDSDCPPRLHTKCPCCIIILCARANRHGVYSRVASIHGNIVKCSDDNDDDNWCHLTDLGT